MKSEMKLNSEYLLEVAIYELNAIWRLHLSDTA